MVMVRVSETYDLSTKVNNMGIVGIHTPTGALIDKLWGGLVMQHKKFRFVSCDVAMACASLLPADPLQVGVEAGEIAPQDMFNPILYKAVSNDSMNTLLNYIQSLASATSTEYNLVNQGSVAGVNDAGFKYNDIDVDQFKMYYALLADSDGWKKAMPQAGLEMRHLFPLVYQMVSTYGVNQYSDSGDNAGGSSESRHFLDDLEPVMVYGPNLSPTSGAGQRVYPYKLRGPAMRMPSINTVCYGDAADSTLDVLPSSVMTTGVKSNTGQVPPCYVGLIILPPAKLNQLYYRLKVTWTIEFTGIRTINDTSIWTQLAALGNLAYGTDYAEQSQTMSTKESMVDADHAMLTKIMEGA